MTNRIRNIMIAYGILALVGGIAIGASWERNDADPFANLPICETEDSQNCYWDGGVRGNGEGTSIIDFNGTAYQVP